MKKATNEDVKRATELLKRILKPGSTIYGIIRARAASGTVSLSPVVFFQGSALHPAWAIAAVTGLQFSEVGGHNVIKIKGYGFDRLDAVADAVSAVLYPGKPCQFKAEYL